METIGKVNRYVCENQSCRAVHGTINLSTGVTPFMIQCRSCGAMAQSSMYRLPAGETACGWAWYRPTVQDFVRLTADEQEHILGGGLILGDLAESVPMKETDEIFDLFQSGDGDKWLVFAVAAYKPDQHVFQRVVERFGMSKRLRGEK